MQTATVRLETAINYNGKFANWQDHGVMPRATAWEMIKAQGWTAADRGDQWQVSYATADEDEW